VTGTRDIVRAVRRGERNPYLQGSPEGIGFGFAEELRRLSMDTPGSALGSAAHQALVAHDEDGTDLVRADEPPLPRERPSTPWRLYAVSALFASRIAAAEGAARDYGAINRRADGGWNAVGRYQFQRGALQDLRVWDDGAWNAGLGIDSEEDLAAEAPLQDLLFAAYIDRKVATARRLGLFADVGQTIEGIRAPFRLSHAGIVAAIHREGEGAVEAYLAHLRDHGRRSDATTFPGGTIRGSNRVFRDAFLAVETRLRTFETVPLEASRLAPPPVTDTTLARHRSDRS